MVSERWLCVWHCRIPRRRQHQMMRKDIPGVKKSLQVSKRHLERDLSPRGASQGGLSFSQGLRQVLLESSLVILPHTTSTFLF